MYKTEIRLAGDRRRFNMQLDKHKAVAVNQMALEMLEDQQQGRSHRFGYPPPPTPSVHTPNYFSGRSSAALRQSTDTPLSMYAMHRTKYKMTVLSSILSPRELPQTVQVPLSALSSAKARPGAVGGSFNSTSKMKCIPLPSIYDHNQVTRRGIRNVTLHSERYTPSFGSGYRTRTVSDSFVNLSEPRRRQKDHLVDREMSVYRSRSLKKAREEIPHRLDRAFYMNGHSAQFFNRQDLSPEEVSTLQAISLSQNKDLYYGKGIRSVGRGRGPSRAVQRFESQLREATVEKRRGYEDYSVVDVGQLSRVSRAITPAEPIPEEDGNEVEKERRNSKEAFITESKNPKRHDC